LNEVVNTLQTSLLKANEEISQTPIYLKVFKKGAPNITLFDLPGIATKTIEIEYITKYIIAKYVKGQYTTILLALPSNMNFLQSHAIEAIKNNDNYVSSTIPVITKIDLAMKTIHAKLAENVLKLKNEAFITKNRSQEDNDNKIPFEIIRKKEREVMEKSEELKNISSSNKGSYNLLKKLLEIQNENIIKVFPKIKDQIQSKILEYRKLINNISVIDENSNKDSLQTNINTIIIERYNKSINNLERALQILNE